MSHQPPRCTASCQTETPIPRVPERCLLARRGGAVVLLLVLVLATRAAADNGSTNEQGIPAWAYVLAAGALLLAWLELRFIPRAEHKLQCEGRGKGHHDLRGTVDVHFKDKDAHGADAREGRLRQEIGEVAAELGSLKTLVGAHHETTQKTLDVVLRKLDELARPAR